jgi:FkbM family methyltransferase
MHVPWRKRVSRIIRGKMRARILSNHGEGIVANSRNGLLVVDPRDFNVSRSLLTDGAYAWSEIEWLGRILHDRSRLVFVGAHIGSLLVPLALRSGSRDITAFEPSPRNHHLLTMNTILNGLHWITVHRMAVGDAEGTARFTENRINSGNSRIAATGEVEVRTSRLDVVLESLPEIDLLVMDTEGFEVHAMRGGAQTLGRTRYFFVEYAPEQLVEQGSRPEDFLELAAQRFRSMYIPGDPVRFFPDKSYVSHLRELPKRPGFLVNLMFSNDAVARPELMISGKGA